MLHDRVSGRERDGGFVRGVERPDATEAASDDLRYQMAMVAQRHTQRVSDVLSVHGKE